MLPADELVRDGDAHHVEDAAAAAQVERAELLHVPDQSHDRAGNAAADEGFATRRAYQVNDRLDILLRGLRGHHHDHRSLL